MRLVSFAAAALITALTGCSGGGLARDIVTPRPDNPHQVVIWEYKFKPDTLAVPLGTTVTWVNRDVAPHTATHRSFTAEPFDSGHMPGSAIYAHRFHTAGSYDYLCIYHQGMRGTIVVQ